MLPGLSAVQIAVLRSRSLTSRAKLMAHLKKYGENDPVIQGLPKPARADLVYSPVARIPLRTALALGEKLRHTLKITGGPYIGPKRIWIAGSVRRNAHKTTGDTKDLDILLVLPNSQRDKKPHLALAVSKKPNIVLRHSYASGNRRRSFIVGYGKKNYRVDMFLAYDDELPYALYHHTGSSRYNIRIRAHAKSQGWKLNQYGLYDAKTGTRLHGSGRIKSEYDLARFIGVTPREPKDRFR